MGQVVLLVITIVISLLFALMLYGLAVWRGVNRRYWTIMGFLFGPFVIPFIFFAKRVDRDQVSSDVEDGLG
jgi:hypothetical protein